MKILWLSHLIPYPPKGGVLQRSYNLIKEMGKYHEITLVSFNQSALLESSLPEQSDPLAHAKEKLMQHVKSIKILSIPEERLAKGRYLTALKALLKGSAYNMEWLISSRARRVLAETLLEESFDVVHVDTVSLAPYFYLFEDIPIILNHHNFESEMLSKRSETESNYIKSLFYRYESNQLLKSEIFFSRKADLNLTCSDRDTKMMQSVIGENSFCTVPNGVDISYFYPNPNLPVIKNRIVIVGGLSWYPNREAVEFFIREIWPVLKKEVPNITVDIIGRNPTSEIVDFGNKEENVNVLGFVDDIRDFLWRADFYLCPIKTGGGTKLKILDALATGCCIISDPFACLGIDVEDNKHVIYAETPMEYVNSIKELQGDQSKRSSLKEAGPVLIKDRYSYQSIGAAYSNRVLELCDKKARKEEAADGAGM
jgi:glycosyltransferase involved in cell wall biosynthesis